MLFDGGAGLWPDRVRLDGLGRQLRLASFGLMLLLATALYCRWRNHRHLYEAALLSIWMVALSILLNLLMQICGRSPAPLVDHQLAHIDSVLFAPVVRWIRPVPALGMFYDTLPWLMLLAVMLPCLRGHYRQAQQYIVAVMLAASISAALFVFCPAVGPWVVSGHQPSRQQAAVPSLSTPAQVARPDRDGHGHCRDCQLPLVPRSAGAAVGLSFVALSQVATSAGHAVRCHLCFDGHHGLALRD